MAKKEEKIIPIISKSLACQDLTEEELDLCCDLTQSILLKDFPLSIEQSEKVINWCIIQKRKLDNKLQNSILEEGIFKTLRKLRENGK